MFRSREGTYRKEVAGSRFAPGDVLRFLRRDWKFLTLMSVIFSVVAVVLTLLTSEQYTKQLNLSVTPVQSALLKKLTIQPMTVDQTGSLAAGFLPDGSFGEVGINATYSNLTQQVAVTLTSGDRASLEEIGPKVVDRVEDNFREMYEETLGAGIEAEIENQQAKVDSKQGALAQVERQSAQIPSELQEADRAQALENARIEAELEVATIENEIRSLERAREDLPRLATEPVAVEIVSETEIAQSRPLGTKIALGLISAFALAVLVTILRAALSRNG